MSFTGSYTEVQPSTLEINMADTSEESSSESSDSISSVNFSIYTESRSSDEDLQNEEPVFPAGKAYLKINLLVKTPLHEFMAVACSG